MIKYEPMQMLKHLGTLVTESVLLGISITLALNCLLMITSVSASLPLIDMGMLSLKWSAIFLCASLGLNVIKQSLRFACNVIGKEHWLEEVTKARSILKLQDKKIEPSQQLPTVCFYALLPFWLGGLDAYITRDIENGVLHTGLTVLFMYVFLSVCSKLTARPFHNVS